MSEGNILKQLMNILKSISKSKQACNILRIIYFCFNWNDNCTMYSTSQHYLVNIKKHKCSWNVCSPA
jgi:hypothetical protein